MLIIIVHYDSPTLTHPHDSPRIVAPAFSTVANILSLLTNRRNPHHHMLMTENFMVDTAAKKTCILDFIEHSRCRES